MYAQQAHLTIAMKEAISLGVVFSDEGKNEREDYMNSLRTLRYGLQHESDHGKLIVESLEDNPLHQLFDAVSNSPSFNRVGLDNPAQQET